MNKSVNNKQNCIINSDEIITSKQYEQELSKLNKVLQDLELYISEKEIIISQITEERNKLYELLQNKQELISELYAQISDIQSSYDSELHKINEEKREIQAIADEYRVKAKRFDDLIESITKIKKKAEKEALQIVENAQKKSMETVSIINTIINTTKNFSFEIDSIKDDIKVGQKTIISDRLTGIQEKINSNISILCKLCSCFYTVNGITIPEEIYKYNKIANNSENKNLPK